MVLLVAAGCGGRQETTPPPPLQPAAPAVPLAPPPPVAAAPRVGLLLPLSGSAANLGQDLLDAAQLALFDVGQTGLELLPRDTGDRPEQAAAAARSALDAGAELLIGPLFGRSAVAVAPVAAERGVGVISFSNDASIARPGLYTLGFRPEEQVERVVGYAASQGRYRFAALAPEDAYGALALAAWRSAVARTPGATPVVAESYPAASNSPQAAVERVAAVGRPGGLPAPQTAGPDEFGAPAPSATAPPDLPPPGFDALLVADGGPRVASIAALLAYYDVAPPPTALLGTMRWQDDPTLLADPGLQGSWLATWPPEAIQSFERRFEAVYGRAPAPLAVLAYDATALAVLLAQGEPRFTQQQLTDPQGFVGGAGIFRLRPDGLADHGLAVVEVRDGGVRVIDPAPPSFTQGLARR
jgi:ABC-type branched-subunit amino acid transport system substrate-binding protein